MEKKIDAVKLMREIRLKLGEKYSMSREEEMRDLEKKFGYLKKARLSGVSKTGGRKAAGTAD
jgi:hypothetical protein